MSQFIEMFEDHNYTSVPLAELIDKSFSGEWGTEDENGNGTKVIRTTNITNSDKLDLSDVVTRNIVAAKLQKKQLCKGDILLERSGGTKDNPVGRVAYFDEDGVFVTNNFTQTLRCNDNIESRYLFYFLYYFYNLNKMKIRSMGNQTTGIQNLNMDDYMHISVIVPPRNLQKQFISIVTQADKSKFVGFKSQFIEMSKAWPVMKLNGHVDIIRGVSYKPSDVVSSLDANSVGILRANNIANGEINTNEMVYVDQSRVSDAQRIRIGDIIVCASSGSQSLVGKAAINKNLTREYAHGAFCLLIRCNNTILPKYLNIYLQTALYRNQIESLSCGSNILNIKADHLTSLDIPIPDIKQQSDFVTIIEQADKSKLV